MAKKTNKLVKKTGLDKELVDVQKVGAVVVADISSAADRVADAVQAVSDRFHSGLIADIPDPRDWLAQRILPRGLQLPLAVDLRPGCSPVEDQGDIGSCTAQAGVGLMEYFDRLPDGKHVDLSRLALYFWERQAMGTFEADTGASLRTCMKQLAKGVCAETLWPYEPAKFAETPSQAAEDDRPNHAVTDYYRISPMRQLYEIKAALAQGLPVLCGIMLHESAVSEAAAKTGALPLPLLGDAAIGGHAVLIVGYDDLTDTLTFRNSWGEAWGDKGYGTLPQRYASKAGLMGDVWVARKVRGEGC